MSSVQLYDTTLRDGAQREGISFSVVDKLHIARKLDGLGIQSKKLVVFVFLVYLLAILRAK